MHSWWRAVALTTCGTAERSALRSQSEASATRSRAFSAPLRLAWRVITAEENSDCTYTDLMILIGLLNIAPGVCSMLIARCEQTRQNEHLRRPMFSCLSTCCNQRFDNHAKEFERGPRFFFFAIRRGAPLIGGVETPPGDSFFDRFYAGVLKILSLSWSSPTSDNLLERQIWRNEEILHNVT